MQVIAFFPQGLEIEGSKELISLGVKSIRISKRIVFFDADKACLYRLYLQARLPFRILREMASFSCRGPEQLYFGIQKVLEWRDWLKPSMSFRVDISGISEGLTHSHFSALNVKNSIVDLQKKLWNKRSNINVQLPDLCIHVHLENDMATLYLDGSGNSLHRRGYRPAMGIAPLKENLAAGLIKLSGWNESLPLIDPLCGSGTLLIEAAAQALKLAPGLNKDFILKKWFDFDTQVWEIEKENAKNTNNNQKLPLIIGCEKDKSIASQAIENIKVAGLAEFIQILPIHFKEMKLPDNKGIILCNPPYGKRLGSEETLHKLYHELGMYLKENASGWVLWLLSGNPNLTSSLRMKSSLKIPISNGGIDCRWLKYLIR